MLPFRNGCRNKLWMEDDLFHFQILKYFKHYLFVGEDTNKGGGDILI